MHRFFWIILTINLFACQAISETQSDIQPHQMQTEAEKAKRVQAILAQYPLELSRVIKRGGDQKQIDFCNEFYSDFKVGKNIEYIEPVIRTDDMDHPGLKHYRQCREYDWDVPAQFQYFDLNMIGDYGFRLYRLDLDHDLSNGEEEIIYGELNTETLKLNIVNAYEIIDLNNCSYKHRVPFYPDNGGFLFDLSLVENHNALIRYRGDFYMFDLHDMKGRNSKKPFYSLELWKYITGRGFKSACGFIQPPSK